MKYFYAALVMSMALFASKANCAAAAESATLTDRPDLMNRATYSWDGHLEAGTIMVHLSRGYSVDEDTVTSMLKHFEQFEASKEIISPGTPDKDTASAAVPSAAPSSNLALIENCEKLFLKMQNRRRAPESKINNVKAFFEIFKRHADDVRSTALIKAIDSLKNDLF